MNLLEEQRHNGKKRLLLVCGYHRQSTTDKSVPGRHILLDSIHGKKPPTTTDKDVP